MSFPTTQDTFSDEANVVYDINGAPIGGTFTDAVKQNALYTLVEQMQLTYGLSGDTASPTGSLTGQIKYLLAQAGGITQAGTAPGGPTDGALWLDWDDRGIRRYEVADTTWHLVGANALEIGGRVIDTTDTPADGDAITWDNAASKWKYSPASGFSNPMTTPQDLIVGGSSGAATRLGVGSNGQVLGVSSGAVAWVTNPSGFTNPMTNVGDMLMGSSGGAAVRLAAGPNGYTLQMVGTQPGWVAVSPLANPLTTEGDLIVSGTGGTPGRLGIGSNGQVLGVLSGAVQWVAGASNPMTTVGDLIIGGSSGTMTRLAATTNGYVLTLSSGSPVWAASGGVLTPTTDIAGTRDQTFLSMAVTNIDNAGQYAQVDFYNRESGPVNNVMGRIRATTEASYKGKMGLYVGNGASPTAPKLMLELLGTTDVVSLPGTKLAVNGNTYTWPSAALVASTMLQTDASGVLSWVNGVVNPMTTAGDIIKAGASGVPQRLAVGSNGDVLTIVSGAPAWAAGGGSGHTIEDEGTPLTARTNLNFVGAGVTVTDDSGNSATVVTIPGGGGTSLPLFDFTAPPAASAFTWINQGTSSTADDATGIYLDAQGGADSIRAKVKSTTGKTKWTACFLFMSRAQNTSGVGLCFTDGTGTPKLQCLNAGLNAAGLHTWQVNNYNSPTSYNTTVASENAHSPHLVWMQLEDDGTTTKYFRFSYQGKPHLLTLYSVARANFLTPTHVGFYANSGGGGNNVETFLLSWQEE